MRFTHLMKQISVFLCLVFLSCTPTTAAPNGIPPTTCSVTILGTSGKLFCNFGVDLRETKHDFQVQRYDSDPDDTDPDRVLVCNWRYPASLSCKVNDAYAFSGHVSDEAVIEIPKVTKETEGLYRCHMIPPDAKMEFCVVSLSGQTLDRRPVQPSESTQPATNIDQTVPSTTHQCERDEDHSSISLTSFAISMTFASVVAVIVGILIGHWKVYIKVKDFLSKRICHQSKKQECSKEQGESNKNEEQLLNKTPGEHIHD